MKKKWFDVECRLVFNAACDLRKMKPELTAIDVLRQAQKLVLPPEKQIILASRSHVPKPVGLKLRDAGWPEFAEYKGRCGTGKRKRKIEQVEAQITSQPEEPPIQVIEFKVPVKEPVSLDEVMASASVGQLIGHLIDRFLTKSDIPAEPKKEVAQLFEKLSPLVQPKLAPPISVPAPVEPKPKRRPVVAVIGLLPEQFNFLREKDIPDSLELAYVEKDRNSQISVWGDYLIVVRHISHSKRDQIKRAFSSDRTFLLREGGISTVVRKLWDIHSLQTK